MPDCAMVIIARGPQAIRAGLGVLGLLALLAGLSAIAGCAGSPYAQHARAATITSASLAAVGGVADVARDAALDRVEAEHPMHGETRSAALDAEAARWQPVGAALDTARSAVLAWVESIDLARIAGDDGDLLPQLGVLAGRAALLYGEIARLLAALGVEDVPVLPGLVEGLAGSLGGGR